MHARRIVESSFLPVSFPTFELVVLSGQKRSSGIPVHRVQKERDRGEEDICMLERVMSGRYVAEWEFRKE
jgi:hypothetical protein